jgi:hypothetical protein
MLVSPLVVISTSCASADCLPSCLEIWAGRRSIREPPPGDENQICEQREYCTPSSRADGTLGFIHLRG